jgi:hypothetical protein
LDGERLNIIKTVLEGDTTSGGDEYKGLPLEEITA